MKINEFREDLLYEMANLTKSITGIEPVVFCSPQGNASHACRVKVSNSLGKVTANDLFSVDLKDLEVIGECKLSHDNLEAVKWWIFKNRFVILDYWKSRIDTREFMNTVHSIGEQNE